MTYYSIAMTTKTTSISHKSLIAPKFRVAKSLPYVQKYSELQGDELENVQNVDYISKFTLTRRCKSFLERKEKFSTT